MYINETFRVRGRESKNGCGADQLQFSVRNIWLKLKYCWTTSKDLNNQTVICFKPQRLGVQRPDIIRTPHTVLLSKKFSWEALQTKSGVTQQDPLHASFASVLETVCIYAHLQRASFKKLWLPHELSLTDPYYAEAICNCSLTSFCRTTFFLYKDKFNLSSQW